MNEENGTTQVRQDKFRAPVLSFGASSLGAEFRGVQLDEVFASIRTALELGLNFIDTSPYYGRGMSEVLLGIALSEVPRDSYLLCTKLGRFAPQHFDFSAKRVVESVDVSLHRLRTDHIDIILCHDIDLSHCSKSLMKRYLHCERFNSKARSAMSVSAAIR